MSDNRGRTDVAPQALATPTTIQLGQTMQLDLSALPEEQRRQLIAEHSKGMLDMNRRAGELGVEVTTLRNTLGTFTDTARQASQDGNSVTITHTQNSQFGRTEVIMGNTETAGKGRLSKSQTGDRDWTPFYVFGGLVAAVLIAVAVVGS